jgi:transposase
MMKGKFTNFIGIDVSKDKVDVFLSEESLHRVVQNSPEAIREFFRTVKIENALVVLENTGAYERICSSTLLEMGFSIHRANNKEVYRFRGKKKSKNDKLDSILLAGYGEWMQLQKKTIYLYKEPRQFKENIRQLSLYISEQKAILAGEKKRLQSPGCQLIKDSIQNTLDLMEQNILKLETELNELIDSDPEVKGRLELMCKYKGIGRITAINLIAHLPELGVLNRKAIASLSGTAPRVNESGNKIGYRSTKGVGRPIVKRTLFMAALSAIRHNEKLRAYWERKKLTEKVKMKIMVAVMHKMVIQLNAILKAGYIMQ